MVASRKKPLAAIKPSAVTNKMEKMGAITLKATSLSCSRSMSDCGVFASMSICASLISTHLQGRAGDRILLPLKVHLILIKPGCGACAAALMHKNKEKGPGAAPRVKRADKWTS